MFTNLQKRFKAKTHIKGLKSKKSLLEAHRLRAGQKGDRYWISEIDSDLQIVNELLEEALLDFKEMRYRLP